MAYAASTGWQSGSVASASQQQSHTHHEEATVPSSVDDRASDVVRGGKGRPLNGLLKPSTPLL